MRIVQCSTCRESVPSYDSIYYYYSEEEGSRPLCSRCFNKQTAEAGGFSFTHVRFDPVELTDPAGEPHLFHFRTQLLANGCHLAAVEVKDGQARGYEFEVIGDPQGSPFALMAQLLARMQRGLAVRHLTDAPGGPQIENRRVYGRITWDEKTDGKVPLMVIDGREVSWEELGRMVMSFEGWRFKLEMHESDEEDDEGEAT
jgi:hypothetical protein